MAGAIGETAAASDGCGFREVGTISHRVHVLDAGRPGLVVCCTGCCHHRRRCARRSVLESPASGTRRSNRFRSRPYAPYELQALLCRDMSGMAFGPP